MALGQPRSFRPQGDFDPQIIEGIGATAEESRVGFYQHLGGYAMRASSVGIQLWCRYQQLVSTVRRVTDPLADDRGDLSAYLAQGVLALVSTTSLTGTSSI